MPGYLDACLQQLVTEYNVRVMIVCGSNPAAPYDETDLFKYADAVVVWDGKPGRVVPKVVASFAPMAMIVSSWHLAAYRSSLWSQRKTTYRILAMDNQWHGTLKQRAGVALRRAVITPFYDAVFVPGDRQEFFARKLGFDGSQVLRGMLSANTELFGSGLESQRSRSFLFAGRLAPEKGLDVLLQAYRRYRNRVMKPWPLRIAGAPNGVQHESADGVTYLGFLQPSQLAQEMHRCSCFVLPSSFEPWGVALHEAATAGMVLITSDKVGSATQFVDEWHNGWIVPSGSEELLCEALVRVSLLSSAKLSAMSSASSELGRQWTTALWATHLHAHLQSAVAAH